MKHHALSQQETSFLLSFMGIIHFCLFLASFLLSISILSRFKERNHTPNLPPGPWKLPFIGNIHNLIGAVPHHGLHSLSLKYGPMMHLQLGELSAVIISSPEAAKQVMKTHDVNFASRPSISAAEIFGYGCTTISFAPYGDYWRQLKKICTLELLSMKRVQSFRSIREQVFTDVVMKLALDEGSSVNLTEMLYDSAYMVTSWSALGNVTKEKEMLLAGIRQGAELASGFDVVDLYPSIKLLHRFSLATKKLQKCHEETDFALEKIIQDHKDAANLGSTDESRKHEDLLDVLLRYQDEGSEVPLTKDNIKAVLVDILTGGSETSATTVNWAMVEMMKNPTILKKAQQELRGAFDDKGYVDESGIDQLKYMKCIIKETLRMHPPLPLLLPRKGSQTCQINGYEIPANTKVIVNAWAVNRDSAYWTNPNTFQPERFLDSKVDYKGNNFEYIPFGAGRRICPGLNFGLANVQLPLAMFLYYFDWNLPVGMRSEDMDMAEGFGGTARRKIDLCIIPVLRRVLPGK